MSKTKEQDIAIVYEDDGVVVVNKPAGLVVHADGKTAEKSVVDWVLKRYPEMEQVGEPLQLHDGTVIPRPGIVHRLDRETSGVLVMVKTQESFFHLKKQFQGRSIEKIYNAFVYDTPPNTSGVIDKPIGRHAQDFRLWSAEYGARGKLREAQTEYRVLEKGHRHTYIEAHPKTGRTHQLRVHFKAIGHPIVCDRLYAPKRPCELDFERLALHARSLSFQTIEGKTITAEAALPSDFEEALEVLRTSSA